MSVRNAVTGVVKSDRSILFGNTRSRRGGFRLAIIFLWLFRYLFKILHDYGNATIGCVEGCTGRAQHLIGVAADLRDLVRPQPTVLHQAAGGGWPGAREIPIGALGT